MKRLATIPLAGLLALALTPAVRAEGADGPNDRVLVLLAKQFNRTEFWMPYEVLRAAGYTVDVAAPEKGRVPLRGDEREHDQDGHANLALKDVDPSKYVGLVIPGGYAPGNLEKHPESLDICRAFMEAGRPVAAICHGPRLLMRAGLMKDRVGTCLAGVANELADAWADREYGKYVERSVVVDGNLITSPSTPDTANFCRATLRQLEEAGGLPTLKAPVEAVVVGPGLGGHEKWTLTQVPEVLGVEVAFVGSEGDIEKFLAAEDTEPAGVGVLLVVENDASAKLLASDAYQALEKRLGSEARKPVVCSYAEGRRKLVAAARRAAQDRPAPSAGPVERTAAIALRRGFDGKVYAAMHAYLRLRGHEVLVVGPEKGWLVGLNGMPVEVQAEYSEDVPLARDAVVVAPGGLWPEKADARQSEQPDWIEEQAKRDKRRMDWLHARREGGATLFVVGLDSLRMGRGDPAFKGKTFAAPTQTMWSFGKDGGRYSGESARWTDERLLSCKGYDELPEAIRLLEGKGD